MKRKKMHSVKKRNRQLLILAVLSAAVLLCVMAEAQKRIRLEKEKNNGNTYIQKQKEIEGNRERSAKKSSRQMVRVLLKNNQYANMVHKKVKLTSTQPFCVMIGNNVREYPAHAIVTFKKKDAVLKKNKISIEAKNNGKVKILSIKRQNRHPSYRGKIELSKKGGIAVVNILPLEQYLYAVVPSELSTGNKIEALKAQAVCARSYIYAQLSSKRYQAYGADVDDSTACQVYNNIAEDAKSRRAVNETKGQVLTSKGKVISTYYFSTSWGSTASAKEVWNTSSEIAYLPAKLQITQEDRQNIGINSMDLSDESRFRQFLSDKLCDTYDSQTDWYRWNVTISQKSLTVRFDSSLTNCYQTNPNYILTKTKAGNYKAKPITSIGALKDIKIAKREKSGLVTQLLLIGENATVKVCTQYNIRKVLAPLYEQIQYKNGAAATTMQLLPSAAFYIDKVSLENEAAYRFTGGGFGHGCGMSQEGAARMAQIGKSYREILMQYFTGAKITQYNE